tara:strand:- start:104 stop:601 length:498 start_codon:yes stop_codon:yes gene_type:complete
MELVDLDSTFPELARKKGYIVKDVDKALSKNGIDFHVQGIYRKTKKEVNMLFAVKRRKSKKKSKYLDRWTWIEYKKAGKGDGWIYGPAHFIAFERSNDFVIVNRKVLLDFLHSGKCRVRWDMPFVKTPKEAKYRIFQNPRSGAQITQVLTKEIIKLEGAQVWPKS